MDRELLKNHGFPGYRSQIGREFDTLRRSVSSSGGRYYSKKTPFRQIFKINII